MSQFARLLLLSLVVSVLFAPASGCHHKSAKEEGSRPAEFPKLASIKRIYIDQLGVEPGSDLVREKIRVLLIKSTRFTVVELPSQADAILKGVAGVDKSYHADSQGSGYTRYTGSGVFRLTDSKSTEAIWLYEYSSSRRHRSASSHVAESAVKRLLADTEHADRDAMGQQRAIQ